jgi:hypothetical protein
LAAATGSSPAAVAASAAALITLQEGH